MCGIVGYTGKRDCIPILIEGLKRLEYRGYDSAGIGYFDKDKLAYIKRKGRVTELESLVEGGKIVSKTGIGHTRWATHGIPNEINAHPHFSKNRDILLIHNGIIENYQALKKILINEGYKFESETDSEVIVHLIDRFIKKGYSFSDSVRHTLIEIEGTYGLAIIYEKEPDKIIAAKKGSPLVIGIGGDENIIASDINALIAHTKQVIYLEDYEIAEITKEGILVRNIHDIPVEKEVIELSMTVEEISKGGYSTFMLKEIFEQPDALTNAMRGRIIVDEGRVKLGGLEGIIDRLYHSERIIISGCGTSWHAGLVGEYMFEQYLRIPTEVEYASEFRYRNPVLSEKDAVIFISQSGETADTLAALKEAKTKGALCLGICNAVGSSIARESHGGVYTHAGPEIGVASTKAFTSQLVVLALITILLARRKELSLTDGRNLLTEFQSIPDKVRKILELNNQIEKIAEDFKNSTNFLYLGRGYNFPVALEGALKLKEISYIHAEGYPAAEMKHGPIALIDENMPVVVIAPKDSTYEKIISNIQEVKARNGKIIAIAIEGDDEIEKIVDYVIRVPDTIRIFMPILTVLPLQLLAYHIAVNKGLNVDQPRNLAKSVTVE
ncbi:MAG TPA: glutamine--fructose-6-phosphate transaminase (isomerizing) [Ignavibacteriaceae bacterium]|jgi:glucosamine--fructose-6-phosphate aminotransferase (isomerizing)|nr:glutamine--fructose-6-phosphate transaminase (isomerizing) [Ignavibacteriaceae bacterium]HOJ18360.1 glutamine--fructose-6-phosphate transaminase (isomerizing) [Ignavibacteriaceae bacterium]